jgi:hypothetical protein
MALQLLSWFKQLLSWFKGCCGHTWTAGCSQVYLGQLALNLLWFVIFFDAKKPRAAQLENAGWWGESASLADEDKAQCFTSMHMQTLPAKVYSSSLAGSAFSCRHMPQLLLNPWFSSAPS